MRKFPKPIQDLVTSLTRLPAVGPKTALRYAYALLNLPEFERGQFAQALINLKNIKFCQKCYTHSETELCEICGDSRRDQNTLCVVSHPRDISTIEATSAFKGVYFVLGGSLNPVEGYTPETLRVRQLMERLQDANIREVILAFSPDVSGETTILYLNRQIKPLNKKITRLARGLPLGADIEYADEITLGDAMTGRRDA